MKVELLFFPGCPHVPAARAQLRRAFDTLGVAPAWDEVDVTSAPPPRWGSPTVLVDGVDVAGGAPGDTTSCRLYLGSDLAGAPPLPLLLAALRSAVPGSPA